MGPVLFLRRCAETDTWLVAMVVVMFFVTLFAVYFVVFDTGSGAVVPVMLVGVDVVAAIDPAAIPWRVVDEDVVRAPGEAD